MRPSRYLVLAAILGLLVGVALVAAPAPPNSTPAPAAPGDRAGIPTKGLHADGIGYCVTFQDADVRVEVPFHVTGAKARKERGLPALDVNEFRVSVRNALVLAANQSGRQDLIDAAHKTVAFTDLGDVVTAETGTVCSCSNTIFCKAGPGKIGICGCGGPCGSCEICTVTRQIR